jgi:hypothetical protein
MPINDIGTLHLQQALSDAIHIQQHIFSLLLKDKTYGSFHVHAVFPDCSASGDALY